MSKTLCITAIVGESLIVHEFESEVLALAAMPYVKKWQRETFDPPFIRYHSKQALKHWDWISKTKGKLKSTRIIYNGNDKKVIYQ